MKYCRTLRGSGTFLIFQSIMAKIGKTKRNIKLACHLAASVYQIEVRPCCIFGPILIPVSVCLVSFLVHISQLYWLISVIPGNSRHYYAHKHLSIYVLRK